MGKPTRTVASAWPEFTVRAEVIGVYRTPATTGGQCSRSLGPRHPQLVVGVGEACVWGRGGGRGKAEGELSPTI